MNIVERIVLNPQEQETIRFWAHGKRFPVRLVQRAQIIQMAADGVFSHDIACRLRISRPTVQLWRQCFLSFRCVGLEKDAPRPGRIPKISQQKIKYVVGATPAHNIQRCDALEYPDHGESPGFERSDDTPDLE